MLFLPLGWHCWVKPIKAPLANIKSKQQRTAHTRHVIWEKMRHLGWGNYLNKSFVVPLMLHNILYTERLSLKQSICVHFRIIQANMSSIVNLLTWMITFISCDCCKKSLQNFVEVMWIAWVLENISSYLHGFLLLDQWWLSGFLERQREHQWDEITAS